MRGADAGGADRSGSVGAPTMRAVLGYVAYFSAIGAVFPYLPIYYRSLGLDLSAVGLLAALSAATQLVSAPLWGGLNDTFARSRLPIPAAAMTAAFGAVLLVLARDLPSAAAGIAIVAIGVAGIGPVLDARTLDLLGSDRQRYGQVRAWGSAAFVVSSMLVGILVDRAGVASLFAVYVPCLVLTAVIGLTLPRPAVGRRHVNLLGGAMGVVRGPGMTLFLVGGLLVWTMLQAANAYYSVRVAALGGANQVVGLSWAVGAAVEVPVMFAFAKLSRRFGTELLLVCGAVLFAVRGGAAALAADPLALVAIAPIEGVGFALFSVGAVGFVASRAPTGYGATAQGVYAAVLGLASIIGAACAGAFVDAAGVQALFGVAALGGAGASVVVALAVRNPRSAGGQASAEPASRGDGLPGATEESEPAPAQSPAT
ncbi:MAG TPA: MFS transporter [Candidatus Limnocylindrales bacterium]